MKIEELKADKRFPNMEKAIDYMKSNRNKTIIIDETYRGFGKSRLTLEVYKMIEEMKKRNRGDCKIRLGGKEIDDMSGCGSQSHGKVTNG